MTDDELRARLAALRASRAPVIAPPEPPPEVAIRHAEYREHAGGEKVYVGSPARWVRADEQDPEHQLELARQRSEIFADLLPAEEGIRVADALRRSGPFVALDLAERLYWARAPSPIGVPAPDGEPALCDRCGAAVVRWSNPIARRPMLLDPAAVECDRASPVESTLRTVQLWLGDGRTIRCCAVPGGPIVGRVEHRC